MIDRNEHARADRLLEYGWLMAVADLVRLGERDAGLAMLADRGFTRAKIVAADIEPYDKKALVGLYAEPDDAVFVSGNDDSRVTVIGRGEACQVLNMNAMRAIRENI